MSGKSTSTIARPDSRRRASDVGRSRLGDITRPIRIDRRLTKQRRSTAALLLVAVAIAGALAAALFVLPVQTYFGQDARLEQRRGQLAQLEQVNDDLRAEVERLRTDDGVREAARVELGMVEAGERRQSILALPDVPTDLPDGWPYSLVSGIAEVRRNPSPTAPQP